MPLVMVPENPSGLYFTYDQFVARFGLKNVARHSNVDQDSTTQPDMTRLQFSFDVATEELHAFFAQGPYEIPFQFSGDTPLIVSRWAMTLAYCDLYLARGMSDEKSPTKIQLMHRNTVREMAVYRGGLRELPTTTRKTGVADSVAAVSQRDVAVADGFRNPDQQPFYGWRQL